MILTDRVTEKSIRRRIIGAYDSVIVRWYCVVRFIIVNLRMLNEIEQYIPLKGRVLDIGCGFGLFSLYFAVRSENRKVSGFDLNAKRIHLAERTARRIGLQGNVAFYQKDVVEFAEEQETRGTALGTDELFDVIITLDLVHHVPPESAELIVRAAYNLLVPGGILIVKDIDNAPFYKVLFTWVLDKMMDWRTPVCYRSRAEMTRLLHQAGFEVRSHEMRDILPYPHVLYVCRKLDATHLRGEAQDV